MPLLDRAEDVLDGSMDLNHLGAVKRQVLAEQPST